MKTKFISTILAFIVTLTYGNIAQAKEAFNLKNEDFKSYNISDNYVKENSYVQGNKKYVTSEYQSENLDVDSKVVYDTDADKITAIASLKDEHGNDVEKKFDIMFLRIVSENDFKAEFTD